MNVAGSGSYVARIASLIAPGAVYANDIQPGMLTHIRRALKPSGRRVLLEYRNAAAYIPIRPDHKTSVREARAELGPKASPSATPSATRSPGSTYSSSPPPTGATTGPDERRKHPRIRRFGEDKQRRYALPTGPSSVSSRGDRICRDIRL